jgi:hypothetical protein
MNLAPMTTPFTANKKVCLEEQSADIFLENKLYYGYCRVSKSKREDAGDRQGEIAY